MDMTEQPAKILIVDDIPETRDLIEKILKFEQGIEVVGSVSEGESVVDAIKETSADVVLMDLHLSGIDGIEATKLLKEKYPWVQVIIISTSEGTPDEYRRAMKAGASDFVTKDKFLKQASL
ncbi:MAG: response regulator transcription factor [Anaerolineales bacterium]|nr:MAG: response regulator transcription factor [Anaerolineales bacterium]